MVSRAVVVGVPFTRVPHFPVLPRAREDASRVGAYLVGRGFEVVDDRINGCSVAQFKEALLTMRAATMPGDLALIYFSGHGDRVKDTSVGPDEPWDTHLILSDAGLDDDWFGDYFWPEVHQNNTASNWVTFADACFSYTALTRIERPAPPPPVVPLVRFANGTTEVRRLHISAALDSEVARATDPIHRKLSYATAAFFRAIEGARVSYRQAVEAAAAEASVHRLSTSCLPEPRLFENSSDGRLSASEAFAPLLFV